jgi:WD40-like Beta Propeller Repeat
VEHVGKGAKMRNGMKVALVAALMSLAALTAAAQATQYSAWSSAQKIDEIGGNNSELNTPFQDGCPIQSPDGLSLYIATTRPRFAGDTRTDLDIWVAKRASVGAPWGAPVNLGEPVNSTADDFCPTPVRGKGLFFVSRKATAASCGMGDIYFTRRNNSGGWKQPTHFACAPAGPNSALDEQGPSYVEAGGSFLYFSRSSAIVPGDIYASEKRLDGSFGSATAVAELNSAGNDIQPNVRKDGREVVLSSNRTGTLGGQDIWVATREDVGDQWSAPVNLGLNVNTLAAESRPSLSWDARTLLFGRTPGPEGIGDIYVSTRTALGGS